MQPLEVSQRSFAAEGALSLRQPGECFACGRCADALQRLQGGLKEWPGTQLILHGAYDPARNEWRPIPPGPAGRYYHSPSIWSHRR